MRYREPKEVFVGKTGQRFIVTPIPGADGHWMVCHPAVLVACPRCGAEPTIPCRDVRGHLVLPGGLVQVVHDLLHGERMRSSDLSRLRDTLNRTKYYRANPHEERKEAWRGSRFARTRQVDRARLVAAVWRHFQWLEKETSGDKRLEVTVRRLRQALDHVFTTRKRDEI